MINKLTIRKPNDMHVHFRDADLLSIVVPETDKTYQNCIVMPNLVPPITSQKMAIEYHNHEEAMEILSVLIPDWENKDI